MGHSEGVNGDEVITTANVNAWARASRSPFPHMGPLDVAVWKRFLEVNTLALRDIQYDVGLGGKGCDCIDDGDELKPMWATLIRKRVDVVFFVGAVPWTCEVKPLANMAALGQALTYKFLWDAEGRSKEKARAAVICSRVDADVEAVFNAYGVTVIVVS